MADRYCLAEYCANDCFMGWWLYERDTNDGRRNVDGGWGWLQATSEWSHQRGLYELCRRMGYDPPPTGGHSQQLAEWFAGTFPNGLRVATEEDSPDAFYKLLEIMQSRPRQRRGVIRTVRGAVQADRARRETP